MKLCRQFIGGSVGWKFILLFVFPFYSLMSQEGTWTLSGLVGVHFPRLSEIKEDNRKDIEGWNSIEGIPIGPFPSLNQALAPSIWLSYRFEREFAVTFSANYFSRRVSTSYHDQFIDLDLDRSVGATEVAIGLAYHFDPMLYSVDSYLEVNAGALLTKATASALGKKTKITSDSSIVITDYDISGVYKKSKLIVSVSFGLDMQISESFIIHAEGRYRFANIGIIDGDITTKSESFQFPSSIGFDYSGFTLSVGLGIIIH